MSMYEMQWERDEKCPACGHTWESHGLTRASMAGPPEPMCRARVEYGDRCGCDEHARQAEEDREARA